MEGVSNLSISIRQKYCSFHCVFLCDILSSLFQKKERGERMHNVICKLADCCGVRGIEHYNTRTWHYRKVITSLCFHLCPVMFCSLLITYLFICYVKLWEKERERDTWQDMQHKLVTQYSDTLGYTFPFFLFVRTISLLHVSLVFTFHIF